MVLKWTLIFTCTLLTFCESAFVDTLNKCAIDDGFCLKDLIQNSIKDIGKTGASELNIPPFDPMELKNINIPVLGLMNITLEEGTAKGVKDCVIENVDSGYKEGHAVIDLICDIRIKGKYKLDGISPIIQNLFGSNSIRGDGKTKLKLDKLRLKLEYFYDIIKKDDGELYFKCHFKKTYYSYELGNARISADNIFLGEQDASEFIVNFANNNWKFIFNAVGKSFFDVAMEIFTNILHNFFNLVPAKNFISTDLSPYVKS